MFYEIGFPNLPPADWQKFRKEFSPYRFEKVIDRDEACLRPRFVPLARGVAIASDYLLQRVCHCGMSRPLGWRETSPDLFRKKIGKNKYLVVWNCEQTGLWTVERINQWPKAIDEVLVHPLGRTPVFTRSYQAAMQLAMHCHVNGPPTEFSWYKADPNKDIEAREIARRRRIEEAQPLP